jgi:VCBS repeat protein
VAYAHVGGLEQCLRRLRGGRLALPLVALLACACAAGSEDTGAAAGGGAAGPGGGGSGGSGGGLTTGGSGGTEPPKCTVDEETEDALPPCVEYAPPGSFDPVVKWTWTAPFDGWGAGSVIIPLVGNFTDDDANGSIDLCDVPDILVTATVTNNPATAVLVLLDGATGTEHATFPGQFSNAMTPAIGDIDGDGLLEVIARDWPDGRLVALENDGTPKWQSDYLDFATPYYPGSYCSAISLYDLEGDGHVEILVGFSVFDENGTFLWGEDYDTAWFGNYQCPTPTAADLDGDGVLEVIFGHEAFRADGTLLWSTPGPPGHAAVANFDADLEPEILFTNANGITLIQADGTITFGPVRPTDPDPFDRCWGKPITVHDFDADGKPEAAIGTCTDYSMYEIGATATPQWTASVQDLSGLATGTSFDFLGDGVADAIYEDETQIYVYEGNTGSLEMSQPRPSGTLVEYPVVADVDNDGSADIVVVANNHPQGTMSPSLFVYGDAKGRWVPTRRIWNQHAYHVTNVREDGTIPKVMKKSWLRNNTFRANSQVGELGDCAPPIR